MAFTKQGQTKLDNNVRTPIYDFSKLEQEKSVKVAAQRYFVPLVTFDPQTKTMQCGQTPVNLSKHTIFKFSWLEPKKDGKKGETSWKSVQWSDTGMRTDEGDKYDDPGISLGLNLKADNRKRMPGLHGAESYKDPMYSTSDTKYQVPVLWAPEIVDGDVVEGTGTFAFLDLTSFHYSMVVDALAQYSEQLRLILKKNNKNSEPDMTQNLYVMELTKDPKAPPMNRNSVSVRNTCDADVSKLLKQAHREYAAQVKYLSDTLRWFQPTIDAALAETIEMDVAMDSVHATIARKLLEGWSVIDTEDGPSDAEVNKLFLSLVPQYAQSLTIADASGAILDTTTINLAGDDGDAEPF